MIETSAAQPKREGEGEKPPAPENGSVRSGHKSTLLAWPRRLLARAIDAYLNYHAHAQFKLEMTLFIGLIGFPFFYVLWRWILPQPYNSATLSALGFLIITGIGVVKYSLTNLQRFLPLYSYIAKAYCLPFFFTYMLLMNGVNTVWQLSTMAAFVYVCVLYDTLNAIIVSVVGAALAYVCYGFVTDWAPVSPEIMTFIPIIVFLMIGLMALNYSDNRILREKMGAASTLAGHIAHEMRTPLLGIKFDAEQAHKYLPVVTAGFQWARENGWEGASIRGGQIERLTSSMERIKRHTLSANSVIDMLLMNAGQETIAPDTFQVHAISETIETAVESYLFRPGEREQVEVTISDDFRYFGSDLLLTHTVFNLIKNGLRALEAVGGGCLSIEARRGPRQNLIIVRDDGPGIPAEIANRIFIPFVTGKRAGEGTGIGLAFTKLVVESFGGTVSCRSELGKGAEFVIGLPPVPKHEDVKLLQRRLQES